MRTLRVRTDRGFLPPDPSVSLTMTPLAPVVLSGAKDRVRPRSGFLARTLRGPTTAPASAASWLLLSSVLVVLATSGAGLAHPDLPTPAREGVGSENATERRWQDAQYDAGSADDGRFVEHHLTRALLEAFSSAPLSGRNVVITPVVGQKPQPLVERGILRAVLAANGHVCGSGSVALPAEPCWQLRYGVVDLRLDAAREGITFLWTERCRRRLRADLILELSSSTGEVAWTIPLTLDASEVLPSDRAKSFENPTVIPRHEIPRDHLLLEALAVTAVLASFLLLAR